MSDEQHEHPVPSAGANLTPWVTVAMASQATTQALAVRTRERAGHAGCCRR